MHNRCFLVIIFLSDIKINVFSNVNVLFVLLSHILVNCVFCSGVQVFPCLTQDSATVR